MSFFSQLSSALNSITPPPPSLTDDYDGPEYRVSKYFVFRPALFKVEGVLLAVVAAYLLFFWFGKLSNERRVKAWLDAHEPIYEKQFSKVRVGGLTQDGYSDFFIFSTGRRMIASLHTIFTLRPRHDFFQILYEVIRGAVQLTWFPQDEIQLNFKLHPDATVPDFVWGLVNKDELNWIQSDRWDLTFTRMTENPTLPNWMSVASEYADVTDNMLKNAGPVLKALSDPALQPYFRSLTITDQPRERPESLKEAARREKHVILSLNSLPPSQVNLTVPLVTALFQFIDSLPKTNLRPETKTKLKAVRDSFAKGLKEEAEKPKREEALEAKLAAKKKAEDERIAGLSAAEQQKHLERERKRNIRKQGKMSSSVRKG